MTDQTTRVLGIDLRPRRWTFAAMRKAGIILERQRLPSQAYTVYRVTRWVGGVEISLGKAYGRRELDALLDGIEP